MPRQKFTDVDLIAALQQTGNNATKAAEILGVSRIAVIKRRQQLPKGLLLTTEDFKKNKADIFAEIQQVLLQYISPEKLKKASAAQLVTMVGILEDKIKQIKGLPEHQLVAHAHIHKLHPEDMNLVKQLIERKTQRVIEQSRGDEDDE